MFVEVAELVLSWDRAVWESVLYWRDHPGGYTVSRPAPSQHISLLGLKDWRTGIFNHLRDHLEAKQYKWRPAVLEWCTSEAEVMVCYCILSMYFHRQNSPPRIDPSLIQDRGIQQVVFLLHTALTTGRGNIIQFSSHFNMKEIYLVRPSFSNLPPAFPL